jgi:glyoxylase-like metal-dependent hydrolase (beta-lactamase superfamily II)
MGDAQTPLKHPRTVLHHPDAPFPHTIFAFPPNRDTLGGTAYLILDEVNVLVDCPAWNEANQTFIQEHGGIHWLFLSHRGGIGRVREIQQAFGCEVLIQEQEAYLIPEVAVTRFEQQLELTSCLRAIWTPGYSPGSSCLYYNRFGGVLFSGRHLLPNPQGETGPIKMPKTFHWHRQCLSVARLARQFTPDTLHWICPGANIGFLRGKYAVEQAYQCLTQTQGESFSRE